MQETLALLGLKWDRLHNEVMDGWPLTAAGLKQWGSQTGCNFTLGHWQMERELLRITNSIVLEKDSAVTTLLLQKLTALLKVLSSISDVDKM